uniref:Uncharacterized protein n=1 Tax=Mycena chlorophos TaxID=658473 RepID=A0ABQ0LIE1_MYCCL|nr:predicted protein [Mycena chlorophos]
MSPTGACNSLAADAWSIAVVGAPGVGKTRFISAFVLDDLDDEVQPSESKQSFSRKIKIDDQETIITLLEADESEALLRSAEAFIIMYNATSLYSFQDAIPLLRAIRRAISSDPVFALVANQTDRAPKDYEVSHSQGAALATELGCPFAEASARSGRGVEPIVVELRLARRLGGLICTALNLLADFVLEASATPSPAVIYTIDIA